jgi:integrase
LTEDDHGFWNQTATPPWPAPVLAARPRIHSWVFTNARTEKPYTTIRKVFERALKRATILTGDVTVHTLRHTALSRMIELGLDDYTVTSISGHSSTRMLERSRQAGKKGGRGPPSLLRSYGG